MIASMLLATAITGDYVGPPEDLSGWMEATAQRAWFYEQMGYAQTDADRKFLQDAQAAADDYYIGKYNYVGILIANGCLSHIAKDTPFEEWYGNWVPWPEGMGELYGY